MSRIQTYTISSSRLEVIANKDGKYPVYKATEGIITVTPDSQGKWCKVEDVVELLITQGTELATLRRTVADQQEAIETLKIKQEIT